MRTVISVEHLSKAYRLGQIGTGTFTHDLNAWWAKLRRKPDPLLRIGEKDHGGRDGREIWALRDVSFKVEQGEVLGIIGRNGAGKSTLLKILSRVTAPSSGKIKIKGRVASLLEVGTGFHPELTGRENIYLNGAIMGMSRREIDRKFDEIVDFSEVERFIGTPVKRYSNGMYVRLAFAVAAHLEPEILIVDEVLAVGDAAFQKKCLGKMGDVSGQGRTVLFVSHNMGQVRLICRQGVMLQDGKINFSGPINAVISDYQRSLADSKNLETSGHANFTGFTSWKIYETSRVEGGHEIFSQDPFRLEIELRLENPVYNGYLTILLNSDDGQKAGGWKINGVRFESGTHKIICRIPFLPVRPGVYSWHVSLWDGGKKIDVATLFPALVVSTEDYRGSQDEAGALLNIPCDIEFVHI
jgi:lipopolysaccharide transport system ATP-binding protein